MSHEEEFVSLFTRCNGDLSFCHNTSSNYSGDGEET